ncbi:uncharacterized protein [Watersipora subatra]|uniref:uncharacterized protein n=1 Tax=Watersipora subatra TaxID=2589382 RepID=UPI00355B6904
MQAQGVAASLETLLPNVGHDDHIDMGRIRIERRSHKKLLPPSIRNMASSSRAKSGVSMSQENVPSKFDPLPFQSQYFKSSTILKMVPVFRRHQEMFVEKTPAVPREKPLIIHSERYQYNDPLRPGFERLGQRERLMVEREYLHRLKLQKLARETLPHRETRELLMGGHRASFNERFDIRDELRRLKAIVLPDNARELYHGKGISLPANHSSIKPRHRMPPPLPVVSPEVEDQMAAEAALYRHSKTSLDGLKSKPFKKLKNAKSKNDHQGRAQTMPPAHDLPNSILSRRSTESNLITLPEDSAPLDLSRSPLGDAEGDYVRAMSTETMQASIAPRAESEMDIIIPPDSATSNTKPLKSHTPIKAPTPNPLKAADLSLYDISRSKMKADFQKLDTDDDGHLMYQQVESLFSPSLLTAQKKYLKQIYDITSASTFFGVDEFVTIKCLCIEVANLDHELLLKGYEDLKFPSLNTTIIQYTELFQQVDRSAKGKIVLESLEEILCSALQREKESIEYGLSLLKDVLNISGNDINKVKFIAGIPYFLILATLVKPTDTEGANDENATE